MSDFQRDSVIVCRDCLHPIYALDRGISSREKAGRTASAFRPLTQADLAMILAERPDIPAGWQVMVRDWLKSEAGIRTLQTDRPKSGQDMICPNCGGYWCRIEDREYGSAVDRAYTLAMLDIPPGPSVRRLPRRASWVEDDRQVDVILKDGQPVVGHP